MDDSKKFCPRCKEEKDRSEFAKNSSRPDGLQAYCKACYNAYTKEWKKGSARLQATQPTLSDDVLPQKAKSKPFSPQSPDKTLLDVALQTRNWMRRMGAYEDGQTGHHGYITVADWQAEYHHGIRMWREVKKMLVRLGEPIAVDAFGGHYLGRPGAQATNVTSVILQAISLMEHALEVIEAAQSSPEWKVTRERLEDILSGSRHELGVDELPRLMRGAGFKVSEQFERMLLTAPQGKN